VAAHLGHALLQNFGRLFPGQPAEEAHLEFKPKRRIVELRSSDVS